MTDSIDPNADEPRCPHCMHHSPSWVASSEDSAKGNYRCRLCGCVFAISSHPPPTAAGWPPHTCVTCGRRGRAFTALDTWIKCSDGERCAGCAEQLIAELRRDLQRASFWPTHVLVTLHVGAETKLSRTVCPVMLCPNGHAPSMSEYSWGSRPSWTRDEHGVWLFQGKHPSEVVQLYSYKRWSQSRTTSESWEAPMLCDAATDAELRMATLTEQEDFERALLNNFGDEEGVTIAVKGRACIVRPQRLPHPERGASA